MECLRGISVIVGRQKSRCSKGKHTEIGWVLEGNAWGNLKALARRLLRALRGMQGTMRWSVLNERSGESVGRRCKRNTGTPGGRRLDGRGVEGVCPGKMDGGVVEELSGMDCCRGDGWVECCWELDGGEVEEVVGGMLQGDG
eukprot:1145263-Pelagomonas_calceolata.AAC.4